MRDFGAKEAFFILLLSSLAVALVWYVTWAFWGVVSFITSMELVVGFLLIGIFNIGG